VGTFADLKNEKYLILELEVDGKTYYNHFINEKRVHDFAGYKKFLTGYNVLLNATDVRI
jgi:hypothetical protein